MDSSLDGAGGDSSKCGEMSVDEKRQLVYELSKQTHLASEVLQAWSRQEILQILCAEMGKERKYTGLTKVKIIETLLKIVSEKNSSGEHEGKKRDSDCSMSQRNLKRQRKVDNPCRYVIQTTTTTNASGSSNSVNTSTGVEESSVYCNNLACRAILRREDLFCRRCSCCICRKYDENKDPSLWLTCSSDPPFEGDSCGFSCHLECAFKIEKSGLASEGGGCCFFYCVSCGKTNSLLECWKKQLTIAKETRRVDALCYRLFLVQKLLNGGSTTRYRNLCEVVDEAVKSLEADVGPLTGLPTKMGRGIVNRLQSGPNVQKLCASALEYLETLEIPPRISKIQQDSTKIRFEDVHATSLTVILGSNEVLSSANIVHYSIWHRKASEKDYPEKSTCTLFTPNTRFVVSGLAPACEYCFKVVSFSGTREMDVDEINVITRSPEEGANCSSLVESESPLTNCSTLSSTPSSVEAESNNGHKSTEENAAKSGKSDIAQIEKNVEQIVVLLDEEEEEAIPDKNGSRFEAPVAVTTKNRNHSEASLPITPFRSDQTKNRQARNGNGNNNGDHSANGGSENGLEHCVKIIRQLECSGHIDKDFRQKFLTWYSLRATPQEIRVVKIFIDTFTDDPTALAEQLVHTFDDRVSIKRSAIGGASAVVPSGFCMKLWH